MARAKSKTKKEPRRPRSAEPAKRTAAKQKGAGSDVEKRWSAYWQHRNELEEAVAKVREAREALARFVEIERARRTEFEQVKASLTELLDVEPAHPARPVALASEPRELAAKSKS